MVEFNQVFSYCTFWNIWMLIYLLSALFLHQDFVLYEDIAFFLGQWGKKKEDARKERWNQSNERSLIKFKLLYPCPNKL